MAAGFVPEVKVVVGALGKLCVAGSRVRGAVPSKFPSEVKDMFPVATPPGSVGWLMMEVNVSVAGSTRDGVFAAMDVVLGKVWAETVILMPMINAAQRSARSTRGSGCLIGSSLES
jgi:hypothetical protein